MYKEVFVPEDRKKTETRATLVDTIWDFFTSLKLVIILLLVLSVLSVAGTIIEQNKPLQEYYRLLQTGNGRTLQQTGLAGYVSQLVVHFLPGACWL